MNIVQCKISGVYELHPNLHNDLRGEFTKVYAASIFKKLKIASEYSEDFFSVSHKNVIRGLHFHLPPFDHSKLVFCPMGKILDVVVDLRWNSPTFGHTISLELNDVKRNMIFVPKGMAHGFLTLSEKATVYYKITGEYHASADTGILWNSIDYKWPISENPILSSRDSQFKTFEDWISDLKNLQWSS